MNRAWVISIALLIIAAPIWGAASDPHDAQVEAATGDAVAKLRTEIDQQPLSVNLTVADFISRTGTRDELLDLLHHGDQIGGPRWIDADTCQVKLSVDSRRVRDALVQIAQDHPHVSPLPPEALAAKLRVWEDRTFTATGSSITPTRADEIRPNLPGPWRNIPDDARKNAIHAARTSAVERVVESIGPVQISNGKTIEQLLADPHAGDSLRHWLAGRPVTRLEFTREMSVQITLGLEPRDIYDALADAVGAGVLPDDSREQERIRSEIEQHAAPAVGTAPLPGEPAQPAEPVVPADNSSQPPAWINQALNSESTAAFQGSRLKTARQAENDAIDALRLKVDALTLASSTIGQTAHHDPAVERAVERSLDRARAYRIDYLPDGSAKVKVSLDPHDLWQALQELP